MILYTQTSDNKHEEWKAISDVKKEEIDKAVHCSVYSYSEQHRDGLDYSKVKMRGDLKLDIDAKDLGDAITQLNQFLDLLESKYGLDPKYTQISASGSKGFHIVIPQKIFDSPTSMTLLNRHHGWMVSVLGEECGVQFDMSLYHQRHLLRVLNSRRADGRYKVPLTLEEARALTPSMYLNLVQSPRSLSVSHLLPKDYFSEALALLWAQAKDAVREGLAHQTKTHVVPNELLGNFTDDNLPTCIEWIVKGQSVSPSAQFNRLSMNVGSFIAQAAGLTDRGRDAVCSEFVANVSSDSRKTESAKRAHLQYVIKYAQTGGIRFECGANRSQLSTSPCSGCPVQEAREAQSEQLTQVEERQDGYYLVNSKGDGRKLTTFTLSRQHEIIEMVNSQRALIGERYEIAVFLNGEEEVQLIDLHTEDWISLPAFKKAVSCISGAIVRASEAEISLIHEYINNTQARDPLVRSEQAGIHVVTNEDGTEDRVWLEPGWCLNSAGVTSNFAYTGSVKGSIMAMRGIRPANSEDIEAAEILLKLLESNRPEYVGQMLGWAAACHLKEHLNAVGTNEFPLLHISGIPGSGKTASAVVYSSMTGAHYESGPMAVDTVSPYPIKAALSETTTVARVFDEYNKASMRVDKYNTIYSFLKSAYFRQSAAMGYAGKANRMQRVSAGVEERASTAPVIYMSKETTDNEELRQRSVIIRISRDDHKVGSYESNFMDVALALKRRVEAGNPIQRLTKMMLVRALKLTTEGCKKWCDEIEPTLPRDEHKRTQANVRAIKIGLKFLHECCSEFPLGVPEKITEISRAVEQAWDRVDPDDLPAEKWETPEILINTLGDMAELPPVGYQMMKILQGHHYLKVGNLLWLNPKQILICYRSYTSQAQITAEATSFGGLLALLKKNKYFLRVGSPSANTAADDWICLDLSMLEKRGIVSGHQFAS